MKRAVADLLFQNTRLMSFHQKRAADNRERHTRQILSACAIRAQSSRPMVIIRAAEAKQLMLFAPGAGVVEVLFASMRRMSR